MFFLYFFFTSLGWSFSEPFKLSDNTSIQRTKNQITITTLNTNIPILNIFDKKKKNLVNNLQQVKQKQENYKLNFFYFFPFSLHVNSISLKPLSIVRSSVQVLSLARNDSTLSANSKGSRKDKKNLQASR